MEYGIQLLSKYILISVNDHYKHSKKKDNLNVGYSINFSIQNIHHRCTNANDHLQCKKHKIK